MPFFGSSFVIFALVLWSTYAKNLSLPSFKIDFEKDTFLKDDKPYRYIAGSIQYFRVPQKYWRDRLIKADTFLKDDKPYRYIAGSIQYFRVPQKYWHDRLIKAKIMGCNAVQTYISWFQHEPFKRKYDFTGTKDFVKFIRIAQSLDLDVILRLGPYIDGLQDMGGLPAWLLKSKSIELRQWNAVFLAELQVWYMKILPLIKPLLHPNGGPVIMVQIENEYGSYPACDHAYVQWLKNTISFFLGDGIVYFTVDGPSKHLLECGSHNGTYATVDFGPGNSAKEQFAVQRMFSPHGPLVNTEFYLGWHTMWGDLFQTGPIEPILATMSEMYSLNASFSIYVVHGGTNFGFTSGSEQTGTGDLKSTTTSYDWDAPIREDGELRPKFFQIKREIERLTGTKSRIKLPSPIKRFAYGSIPMRYMGSIFDHLNNLTIGRPLHFEFPPYAEEIDHYYGYILYEAALDSGKGTLNVTNAINDRGYFFVNREENIGITQRTTFVGHEQLITINMESTKAVKLSILVDNHGRISYSERLKDCKGIVKNITFNNQIIRKWTVYRLDFEKLIKEMSAELLSTRQFATSSGKLPELYAGRFEANELGDTWLDTTDWGKGNLFVNNGFNLGRYWPTKGPQMTLYHPYARRGNNTVVAFELEKPGNCFAGTCFMQSVLNPINIRPFDNN
uniref:Beta-galactosidase n=1 Tax=Plectus sambesii TaxID=2011161 RepID=A0A914X6G0_9BILA